MSWSALENALPAAWSTAGELLASAGLWAAGGALVGVLVALVITPLAARWTRGGWAAGCAWALLLVTVFGAGGLYGGAVYGVASHSARLVQEEWLLERLTATTVLAVAEERGLDPDAALSLAPTIREARGRLDSRLAAGAVPGASALGFGLPRMLDSMLDSLEGLDGLTAGDLQALRFEAEDAADPAERRERLSAPARNLLEATAPVRRHAVATIWASALPHFVVVGVAAGAAVGLIFVIGVISRLVGRREAPA